MTRITNDLFEAIRKVTAGQQEQQVLNESTEEVKEGQIDKAHYCATHVEHAIFGAGECIAEAHADPDAEGNIAWYTVQFKDGIRKVYTEAMKVKKAKMHEHAEVTDDMNELEQIDELSPSTLTSYRHKARNSELRSAETARRDTEISQQTTNPTVKAKSAAYAAQAQATADKRRAGQLKATSRLSEEEVEQTDEAMSHQAATTMKHIKPGTLKQNYGDRQDAANIKPGIKGVADRLAMLDRAKKEGRLKEDSIEEGKGDGNLANNYPPYDKVTRGDVISGRLGKDHKGGKDKKAMMKESVPFTFVIENQYDVEIPTNLTYADYLDAVKTIVDSDDPEFQQDIVKLAAEAFDTGKIEVIAEAMLIKQGILEAYRSTADYGNQKLYSKELSGTVDRSKPGVVKFSRDTQQTVGDSQKVRKEREKRNVKVFGHKKGQ